MKVKNIYIAVAFSVSLLSGCNLDVTDPSNLNSESFWKSSKDAWSSLNTCYSSTVEGIGVYAEAYVDNVRCPYPWESNGATFKTNSLSAGDNDGYDFTGIRLCNVFIKNVESVDMDDDLKHRMLAEARVLRAWNYLNLTMDFGKVPLITEPLDYNIKSMERTPQDKVREFVLSELTEAAKVLPDRYSGGYLNEKTRITRFGALALKARAALYFGKYKEAEEAAKEVMNKGGYKLHHLATLPSDEATKKEIYEIDNLMDYNAMGINREDFLKGIFSYRGIWDPENVTPDSPECIIVKEYLPGDAKYADLTRYTSMRPDQMVFGWSSVVPMQNLVDAYWKANSKPFNPPTVSQRKVSYNSLLEDYTKVLESENKTFLSLANDWIQSRKVYKYEYLNEFKNRDARLYASILFTFKGVRDTDAGEDFVYHWRKGAKNESTTGYNFIKMVAKQTSTKLWGSYPCSEVNYPTFRYAEILLTFAEARTYASGYDAEVRSALNQLRDRLGMPHVPASLSKDEAIELIRNERRIELAGEGQRWYDIRRYDDVYVKKHMENVPITQPDGDVVLTMQWNSRMRLKPLPQTAMDLNPALQSDQNPGY